MANTPVVAVGRPDALGLRKVAIDGKTVGKVRSTKELQTLLRHAGLAFGPNIHWSGGGPDVWPDRSWRRCRRWATGALMAVGLLLTAYALSKIGFVDAFDALSFAGRITGFIFLAATVVEVLAAAATLDYWRKRDIPYSGTIILIGVSVSFAFNCLLLFVQIIGGVYTPYLWLWITLTLWGAWALWTLIRGRAWNGLLNPRRVAIGAVFSAVLAVTNLTYSQVYVPHMTSPLVESAAEVGTPSFSRDRTRMYLPVHVHVKNSGEIPVYIIGSIYLIDGRLSDRCKGNAGYELIDAREFVQPAGRSLDPGEEISEDEVHEMDFPRRCTSKDKKANPTQDRFDAIRARTEVRVVRKDRMTLNASYELSKKTIGALTKEGKADDPEGPSGQYFRYQAEISNSNEILNVTRGRQRVTVWWVYDPKQPFIYVDVAAPGRRKAFDPHHPTANDEANDRYGLEAVPGSMTQRPYMELLEAAEAEQPGDGEQKTPDTGQSPDASPPPAG
ncbi:MULTISPECIES: Yip1 family protein [unclassified Streptomyces]|uniref:Yip1 family protein n=1 Tax=unclassified Streptomyces TaxID=2593676 RepID=UPI0022580C94|nr:MULTISPECIES: Yip1 family protein [unclassified Streptomyces]MCX4526410.1 hypothetical protein [Streptomyces sp. NBC_01551]MCX4543027.1 hypothetical protein [Streptomyces sp. NBC_01565]